MAKRQSMTEKVLEALREDIINWVYEENDMITEAEISEKFGVSKTPSREALNYLCMEGFLDKIPNKGYLVRGRSCRACFSSAESWKRPPQSWRSSTRGKRSWHTWRRRYISR